MPLSHSIRFDDARQSYRVRFRGRRVDLTRNVPRQLFGDAGLDSRAPSDRGRRITERWAVEEAQRLESQHPVGREVPEMTLGQLCELFDEKNPHEAGPATIDRHRELAANIVRILGHRLPSQIDDADALTYRNERAKEKDRRDGAKIRNRTIKNELRHLKMVLESGYQWRRETGMRELNLFKLPTLRQQASYHVQLNNEELRLLFAAKIDHDRERIRAILQLGLISMLRDDNLLGARKEWWNLKQRWRTIPAEFMKGRAGEKRELSVPISEWEAEIVGKWIRRRPSSPYLFANFNGRPSKWPRKTVKAIVAASKGKLRYFTAHDLRRTGSAILEEAGRSKVEIQRLMGHAPGGDVTDDYVARAARLRTEERLKETVKVFDQVRASLL